MQYDYSVYGINPNQNWFSHKEQNVFIDNPKLLGNLTKMEQNCNCMLIWNVIKNNRNKKLDYFNKLLKDKDTFLKQITENEFSREMCSDVLTNIFGEEFKKYLKLSKEENKDDYIE